MERAGARHGFIGAKQRLTMLVLGEIDYGFSREQPRAGVPDAGAHKSALRNLNDNGRALAPRPNQRLVRFRTGTSPSPRVFLRPQFAIFVPQLSTPSPLRLRR